MNTTKFVIFVLHIGLGSTSLLAWTNPEMLLDDNLIELDAMQVEGHQGWQVRQIIAFGDYRTGPVKRGWTKGYDYPFTIRFTAAKEKLAFESVDSSGRRAEFFCIGRLSEQDLHRFREYFDVNLRTKDVFSCTVAVDGAHAHDLFVEDLNQNRTSGNVCGSVRGSGIDISIRPVWHLASGKKSWDTRPIGFEFVDGDLVVGAVEIINEGRVWLQTSLDQQTRLVLAGLASALLLRSDLADHND